MQQLPEGEEEQAAASTHSNIALPSSSENVGAAAEFADLEVITPSKMDGSYYGEEVYKQRD